MARVNKEVHQRMSMEHIRFGKEEVERRGRSPVLVRAEEIADQLREHPHVYIADPRLGFGQRTFRFWINRRTPGEDTQVGRKTLGHRHTVEAVIHILEGEGYSVIDGNKYSWEEGDFLCVPVFAWHLHVPKPDREWIDVAATTGPFSMAMGIALYEDERYPEYWVFAHKSKEAMKTLIPGGAEAPHPGSNVHFEPDQWKPTNGERGGRPTASRLYYEQLIYAREEERRRREGRVLVKGKDLVFEPTAMGEWLTWSTLAWALTSNSSIRCWLRFHQKNTPGRIGISTKRSTTSWQEMVIASSKTSDTSGKEETRL